MKFHEVANLFPLLEGKPFNELVEDVKKNGLLEPIWTHDNQVVDGRNRFRACKVAGVEPRFRPWNGKGSLVSFVISLNLKRRHLTPSQASTVGVEALPFREKEARERIKMRTGGLTKEKIPESVKKGQARDFVAKDLGINPRYISDAKWLQDNNPEAFESVKSGKVKLGVAVKKVKKEKDIERRKALPKKEFKNLVCGDAVEELKKLEPLTVDCVVTDPPYGIDFKSVRGAETNDFEQDGKAFALDLLSKTLPELYRVMKEGSHLYVFCSWHNVGAFKKLVEDSGFDVRNCLVWVKNNHTPTNYLLNYAHKHEFVLFASKGRRFLNRELTTDVLEFDNVMGKTHAAEKPVKLLKYLIENSTNKGEVVLDCFAGSGSSLVAAQGLNRSWIGIEKDSGFVDICKERIGGLVDG